MNQFPSFPLGKTLFYPAPGPHAILVEKIHRRRRSKPMRFADPHAALSWCQSHGAAFVYFPVADPAQN
jgi:hypothetical protein